MAPNVLRKSVLALTTFAIMGGMSAFAQTSILDGIATDPLINKAERALLKGQNTRVLDLLNGKEFAKRTEAAHASTLLCQAHYQLGQFQTAVESCSSAVDNDAKNWVAHNVRAGAYYRLGQYSKAVEDFETAAKHVPQNAQIKHNLKTARMVFQERHLAKSN